MMKVVPDIEISTGEWLKLWERVKPEARSEEWIIKVGDLRFRPKDQADLTRKSHTNLVSWLDSILEPETMRQVRQQLGVDGASSGGQG